MNCRRVGIFMKAWRKEPFIHRAIQSVMEQTYPDFRFYILVSADTLPVAEEYAKQDGRIEVWSNGTSRDSFYVYMKRIAAENSYVTTIDADDWYEKEYLEEMISFLEAKQLDIVTCGSNIVDVHGKRIDTRPTIELLWPVKATSKVLFSMYFTYRTTWGTMLRSKVCLKWDMKILADWSPENCIGQDEKVMPTSNIYGDYGGDTIFMFSFLLFAEKAGICGKILYNYRISPTGNSYVLKPGRLDSAKTVFYFVRSVLNYFGAVDEKAERVLYHVYGNALNDTTALLLRLPMDEQDRVEKLLYIYSCELTSNLFSRQKRNALLLQDKEIDQIDYIETLYQSIFQRFEHIPMIQGVAELYLKLLGIFYPGLAGLLSEDEFIFLLQRYNLLDMLRTGKYYELFAGLLTALRKAEPQNVQTCLCLLRRVAHNDLLPSFLQEKTFVLTYSDIFLEANQKNWRNALPILQKSFSRKHSPYQAVRLADLWITLAADAEDVGAFIIGKELKTELLLENGETDAAMREYSELLQMGAADENMDVLSAMFSKKYL